MPDLGGPDGGTPVTGVGGSAGSASPILLPTRFFPSADNLVGGGGGSTERRELTFGSANDYRSIIYGRVRVGASVFGVGNNTTSGYITIGVAIGEGPIEAIEDTEAYGGTGAPWITYDNHLGTSAPSSDSSWSAAMNGAPETYPFLAWSELTYNTTLLSGDIEFPRFIVKGLKLWDPRSNAITHSEDYSSTYWTFTGTSPTVTTQPGLSQAGTTSAYDYAGRWAFGASGSNAASRDTSGLGLATTDSLTVSIDMRVTSGTATVTLDATKVTGAETTSVSCDLTTTWKRFYATVAAGGSGSGEGRIKIRGIASSGTIEVGRAQIEKNSTAYGYKKTVASAVTPVEEYSANPALELADLKTNTRYGQRVGVQATFSGSGVDDLRVFWTRAGTIGTHEVTIDGTGSPNTFKWRFKPLGGSFGSYTTGVAITTNQQLLSNGVYVRLPTLTGHTNADTWTIVTPTALVDWASVGLAAEYCDEVLSNGNKRWECHIALKDKASWREWEETIGSHFGGHWQFVNGLWKMYVHKPTSTIALAVTSAMILPEPSPTLSRQGSGAADMPNRLTVTWVDPTDDWKQKPEPVDNVASDSDEIREGSAYPLLGCQTRDQAHRSATYLMNGILADLRIEFDGQLPLASLVPGDRITVQYDPVGLTAATDFTVESVKRNDAANTVHISAIQYTSAIWSDTVGATDTLGVNVSIDPFVTPPEVRELKLFGTTYPLRVQWDKPVAFKTDSLYGTGSWVNSGNTSYDGTKVNDGSTGSVAFITPVSTSSTTRLDLGSAKVIGAFRIDIASYTGTPTLSALLQDFIVSYSDDDASYSAVTARVTAIVNSSGSYTGIYIDWNHTSFGAHRYWKITYNSGGLAITMSVSEVQAKEVQSDEFPYVKGYEVIAGAESDSPIVLFIPATSTPTVSTPLDVSAFATPTAAFANIIYSADMIVRTVGYNMAKSDGRLITVSAQASATAASQTRPVLRGTTGYTKQSGGLAIDGVFEGTSIDLAPTATGTTHVKVNAPSGQSVPIADVQLNGTSKLKVMPTGDLSTVQSSLITPFEDSQDTSSSDTTITSATVTDITNASKTFTFNQAVRIQVTATWVVTCTTYDADLSGGNSAFRGILSIGGSDQTAEARWIPSAVNKQATITRTWVADVAAGSCTIKMRGRVNSAGVNDYSVKQPHTGFTVVVLGRI